MIVRDMERTCQICRGPAATRECYVRVDSGERPACRPCWEQLFLDPRRLLRAMQSGSPPSPPGLK